MRRIFILGLAMIVYGAAGAPASAKYPILSLFTRTSDGPYQPQVRHYVVIDPVPPAGTPNNIGTSSTNGLTYQPTKHAAHHGGPAPQLWRQYELSTPTYPYGYFGARHANERQTRGSYYDDYRDTAIIRGR